MLKIKFTAIVVATLDGKIAQDERHYSDWSSREDKIFLKYFLDQSDLIVVGNNTYKLIKPLQRRRCLVFTSQVKTISKKSELCFYCNPQNVSLKNLFKKFNFSKIAILGGTKTYSLMLKEKLIDEIYLTIEPIIFGQGLNIFDLKLPPNFFKLISIKKLNDKGSVLLYYSKIKT
ncbi:MAG: hypothetical protein A2729_00825 [Candidatus Buchananbacteria bacterium RIFCSPHIGHO2_01_FULL_39_14]|uniref:Bacterial bifunctional deaminase-reductase C-terminal domain-containing protein n=1 Tax=Candidatus Buchananbacteria bacterium RIFCSPHIGHO2_01_FULL_39_14 TaxID=1797532 RepID=A0A1G1XVZ8_9BACT|nr:MAG: hypothetical protein A2729_00825 [Candidatus Buchananbacteria bacterium RIFCSPHIGHO2_01_FULL_39_14]OGY49576.1 MAG: hypothetical protein A3D39_02080 [Candidatus Buchananbacteria bacterium RIFCSPHIGHO2_02_FULL_39_17]